MEKRKTSNVALSALVVVILALSAAMLLLFAFVLWFAEIIGSIPLSLCITGVVLSIIGWATYKVMLSPTLKQLRDEYEKAILIISLIKHGYEYAIKRMAQLISLLN